MRNIYAVIPGNIRSSVILYNTLSKRPWFNRNFDNNEVLSNPYIRNEAYAEVLAIKMTCFENRKINLSSEPIETAIWIGRLIERWRTIYPNNDPPVLVYPRDVQAAFFGNETANPNRIRKEVMLMYGSDRKLAFGSKRNPGPLYQFSKSDIDTLAVAITAGQMIETNERWIYSPINERMTE